LERENRAAAAVAPLAKEPVDARISLAGLLAAIGGLAYLIVRFHDVPPLLATMMIYGLSLIVLFGSSTLYHGVRAGIVATRVFRTVDHASIYGLIAGSYTPVLFAGLSGWWRIGTIAAIWAVAAAGIVLTVWFVNAPRWLSATIYVTMGWLVLVPGMQLVRNLPLVALALFAAGGLLYTIGAVIYATRQMNFLPRRFGFHEVFHVFVLAAAATQYAGVAFFMLPN
jgi:hemolysin III